MRTKAAANLKNQRQTGGGPNQTKLLSAAEQSIYELVGMKESVEGLENTLTFGMPVLVEEKDQPTELKTSFHGEAENETPSCSRQVTPPPLNSSNLKRKRTEPQDKGTLPELIAKELVIQENLCCKISKIGDSMETHSKEMEMNIKRIYRALEKRNTIMEKHHAKMEHLRMQEVESKLEKNRRIIEIEEMKLQILQRNT